MYTYDMYVCMYICVRAWMDGWMDGCMNGCIYIYADNSFQNAVLYSSIVFWLFCRKALHSATSQSVQI